MSGDLPNIIFMMGIPGAKKTTAKTLILAII